jgi:hypothetical protein
MTQLTEERFEQVLSEKLKASEQSVIKRIDEAQEELARMVASGFEDVQRRLDLSEQLRQHELKFQRLEEALHIKL